MLTCRAGRFQGVLFGGSLSFGDYCSSCFAVVFRWLLGLLAGFPGGLSFILECLLMFSEFKGFLVFFVRFWFGLF